MNGHTDTPVPAQSVTVDPAATKALASTQSAAAADVATRSAAERIDTAALLPTFGLIGAGFLAAVNRVGAARTASLDALATRHAAVATRTAAASAAYECCDADTAGALTAASA